MLYYRNHVFANVDRFGSKKRHKRNISLSRDVHSTFSYKGPIAQDNKTFVITLVQSTAVSTCGFCCCYDIWQLPLPRFEAVLSVDTIRAFTLFLVYPNSPYKSLLGLPKFHFLQASNFSFKVQYQKVLFHYSERSLEGCSAPANYLPMLMIIGSHTRP